MSASNQPAGAGTPQPKQQPPQTTPQPGQKTQLPAKDDDPKSLKQNLVVAFKDVIEYVKTADTANPSVLDLVQSCIDGLDAVFSSLTHRFEQLPESPESDEEPNYKAEDTQGSDIPTVKSVDLGALVLAKALDFDVPNGGEITLNPTNSSRWKAVSATFASDLHKMTDAVSGDQKVMFYIQAGLCLSALNELLTFVFPIIPDTEVKMWKRVMIELRANMKKAMKSINGGNASYARTYIRKLSDCYVKLQERVKFHEANIDNMTKRIHSIFNRS